MKKLLSITLAILTVSSLLASCAPAADQLDPAITLASSDALSKAEWLDERLDTVPDKVIIGIGSNEEYGVDMSGFDDNGYIARAIGGDVLLFGKTEDGLDRAVREYAKAADVDATGALDTVFGEGPRIEKLTIGGRDIADYTIVYEYDEEIRNPSGDAPTLGNTKYAAEEFQRLCEIATGILLPIEKLDETKVTDKFIKIEYYTKGDLGKNGAVYKVEDGNLYIEGVGRANGCANAVYYFFEKHCGWDGLVFGDSYLNEAETLDVPNGISGTVDPMFDWIYMRAMYYDHFVTDKGSFSFYYRGDIHQPSHSIESWSGVSIPWYNMCYNDETIFLNTYDKIYTHVKNQVAAGKEIGRDLIRIDIGMADALKFCYCSACAKLLRQEDSNAAGIIQFGNRIIENLYEEELGGIIFTVYAYHGANIPPKTMKPHEDLLVSLCTDGACINHKLDGSECTGISNDFGPNVYGSNRTEAGRTGKSNNTDFADWIRGWAEITDKFYIYHYALPNNFHSYTALRTIYDDMHFLYELGVDGFQPEAEYYGDGIGRVRFQLWQAVIWNPEMSREEYEIAKDEVLWREFGDGYELVEEMLTLWEKTEYDGLCSNCWGYARLIDIDDWDPVLYADYAPAMADLLNEAANQANTRAQECRALRLLYEVYYRECYSQYFAAMEHEDEELIEYLEERYQLFLDASYKSGVSVDGFWPNGFTLDSYEAADNIHDESVNWEDWKDRLIAAIPY